MDTGEGAVPVAQQPAAADTGAYDPATDAGGNAGGNGGADAAVLSAVATQPAPAFTDPAAAAETAGVTAAAAVAAATTVPDGTAATPTSDPVDGEATTILPTSAAESISDSIATIAAAASSSPPSSSQASTLSSLPPSPTNSAMSLEAAGSKSGAHFRITYLIPVFVLLGLLLLLAIGGKIWGRVAFAKERAMKRNERRRQEAQQIANETRNAYMQPWQEKGWSAFDASMEMQREDQDTDAHSDDEGRGLRDSGGSPSKYGVQLYDGPAPYRCNDSDGDASEHDLRGPLSALGTHLAGQKLGQRAPPPPARMEHDRFKPQLAANSWWSVQWSRHFGGNNNGGSGSYDGLNNVYAGKQRSAATAGRWVTNQREEQARTEMITARRRTKRGVLARMKSRLGWGYDGTSPLIGGRRDTHAFVMPPQAPLYWSRIPQAEDEVGDFAQAPYDQWPQPYGQPMEEALDLNRTLPPTPMTALDTPTPISRRRMQDARRFDLARAQTQSTVSTARRMSSGKSLARSSTVAMSRSKPVGTTEGSKKSETGDESVRKVRQIKSLNSMANAAALVSNSAASRASTLQRHRTMGPLKNAAPRKIRDESDRDTGPIGRGSFKRQAVRKPVNFGDYSDDDEEDKENGRERKSIPALDSFLLTRSRSVKSSAGSINKDRQGVGMVLSDYEGSDIFSPDTDGEVVMDLNRRYSTNYSETSALSSLPALSRGSTRTQSSASFHGDEPVLNGVLNKNDHSYRPLASTTDEVDAEIDHVLLSIIARSNTSKSYARSVGGFASAAASPIQRVKSTPGDTNSGTPVGRNGTWRNEKGRWTRVSPTSAARMGLDNSPARSHKSVSSPVPPPLPTPPLTALPRALLAASPSRGSNFSNMSRTTMHDAPRRDSVRDLPSPLQAISQRSSRQSMQQFTAAGQRSKLGTSHAKIGHDLFFTQHDDPAKSVKEALLAEVRRSAAASAASSRTPTERSQSTRSSVYSELSSDIASSLTRRSSTVATDNGLPDRLHSTPTRRAAITKRSSPVRYTAKLATGDEDDALQATAASYQRLHTGKSMRTAAEKRREQSYAMDRVQSIVTRATAARANQPEPALWMDVA